MQHTGSESTYGQPRRDASPRLARTRYIRIVSLTFGNQGEQLGVCVQPSENEEQNLSTACCVRRRIIEASPNKTPSAPAVHEESLFACVCLC